MKGVTYKRLILEGITHNPQIWVRPICFYLDNLIDKLKYLMKNHSVQTSKLLKSLGMFPGDKIEILFILGMFQ